MTPIYYHNSCTEINVKLFPYHPILLAIMSSKKFVSDFGSKNKRITQNEWYTGIKMIIILLSCTYLVYNMTIGIL